MKQEIENTIEETLLGVLGVYGGDPNIWQHGYFKEVQTATKLSMLTDIVKALCTVDSDILVLISHQIDDAILENAGQLKVFTNQDLASDITLLEKARTDMTTDECEVCGVTVYRSANDLMYDTIPLCANHIAVESPMMKKLYSMMSNEDKQHYFDLEKRQEYYNRYVLGKGDDE